MTDPWRVVIEMENDDCPKYEFWFSSGVKKFYCEDDKNDSHECAPENCPYRTREAQ